MSFWRLYARGARIYTYRFSLLCVSGGDFLKPCQSLQIFSSVKAILKYKFIFNTTLFITKEKCID
jgi:hypothetical protein